MIGIIHYGMGNITSVLNACVFAGLDAKIITTPAELDSVTHIILPGVGAFNKGVANLEQSGFKQVLIEKAQAGIPFLGICLGMQLLATSGEEGGTTPGLNLIPGTVVKFPFVEPRVPHVGWNNLLIVRENPIIMPDQPLDFYFVHSYFFVPVNQSDVIATCDYGGDFTVAIQHKNIFGVQFHPEKSFVAGLAILKRFAAL